MAQMGSLGPVRSWKGSPVVGLLATSPRLKLLIRTVQDLERGGLLDAEATLLQAESGGGAICG